MRDARNRLAKKHAEVYSLVAASHDYPKAAMFFYMYAALERRILDTLRSKLPRGSVESPEHDGFSGVDGLLPRIREILAAEFADVSHLLAVKVKPYPRDPFEGLKLESPGLDWTLKASSSANEFADVVSKCISYVAGGTKVVKPNSMTFARFVAMQMRSTTNVPHADGERRTHFETFSGDGFWITRHRDDMTAIISEALSFIVRPVCRPRWDRGDLADPPPPLNDGKFACSLDASVLGLLSAEPPMAQLDGEHSRGKLLFKCGTVVDFINKSEHRATPEDRLGHRMGCTAKTFVPADPAHNDIFEMLVEWCKQDEPLAATNLGVRIVDMLREIQKECDVLELMINFANDWEKVIWLLRAICRMSTGNPRICEFLYMFGGGSSGKDVIMLLLLHFFGEHQDNYGCMLNGDFLVDNGGKSSKEGPSPFLAGTQGKRFVWVSEVPQHKNLQVNLIKQYCEMNGAPITARKLYKAPVTFRPTGVICATSNFAPNVSVKDDSGFTRRARIWATTRTFAAKPTKVTEVQADPVIKQRIQSGHYNPQLLWLVKGMVATLTPDVNPSTTLEPCPPSMKHLEEECQEGGLKDEFEKFIKEKCAPTTRKDASNIKDFKAAVAAALGISKPQVGTVMQEAGYKKDGESNGGVRVAVGHHPDRAALNTDGLALKPSV